MLHAQCARLSHLTVLLSRSQYAVDYFLYYMHCVVLQRRVCTQLFQHVVAFSLFICFTLFNAKVPYAYTAY
jgi:hypothetical protein